MAWNYELVFYKPILAELSWSAQPRRPHARWGQGVTQWWHSVCVTEEGTEDAVRPASRLNGRSLAGVLSYIILDLADIARNTTSLAPLTVFLPMLLLFLSSGSVRRAPVGSVTVGVACGGPVGCSTT